MKDGLSKAVASKMAMFNAFGSRFRSGRPRVQLLQLFLEAPELTPTPVDSSLEAGYIRSQLKAWGEKKKSLNPHPHLLSSSPVLNHHLLKTKKPP